MHESFIPKIVLIVIVVILFAGGAGAYFLLKEKSENGHIACTEEAKLCPDGSAVGRVGPNCEFALCPSEALCEGGECPEDSSNFTLSEVEGRKTYRNEEYGFEVRYPTEWNVEFVASNRVILHAPHKDQLNIGIVGHFFKAGDYRIPLECPWSIHQIDCSHSYNQNGIEYVRTVNTGLLERSNQREINVFFDSSDIRVTIHAAISDENGEFLPYAQDMVDVIDEIISTFKFIDNGEN